MENKKLRIGVLFGGKSAEHEVSLQSAKNIVSALDRSKYDVTLIGISKTGDWLLANEANWLLNSEDPKLVTLNHKNSEVVGLIPSDQGTNLISSTSHELKGAFDVVFPVLHGPFGEDGTVQGLLKLANIPFVGASVLGSAIGMDKDVMKRLMRDADIPIAKFICFDTSNKDLIDYEVIKKSLGSVLFVKPANLGSSVGISRATNRDEFFAATEDAFRYDSKIIIEEEIKGREIECSVMGNEIATSSIPGEIIPKNGFYSYDAKYIDADGAGLEIPAKLSPELVAKFQRLAVKTFKTLCCEGLARVDFFLKEDGTILVNEINTLPGFTKISMYPKLWEASGVSYSELLDKLIELALARHGREKLLRVSA